MEDSKQCKTFRNNTFLCCQQSLSQTIIWPGIYVRILVIWKNVGAILARTGAA
jgi:hypothetical protein